MKLNELERYEKALAILSELTDTSERKLIECLIGTAIDEEEAYEIREFIYNEV